MADGNRNRDIAERLFESEHSIKIHVRHILEKLGASDRTHAIAIAGRRGFIHVTAYARQSYQEGVPLSLGYWLRCAELERTVGRTPGF